ncbi:MAG: sensor histidine kinase [Bacilli bacterium]
MIRRSIAIKIGLSILGLIAVDLLALYLSLHQLISHVLASRGAGQVTAARVELLLILSAVGAILLATGMTVFLSQRLAQPLVRMIHVTHEIGQGHLDARVPARGDDEVARLGEAINELARRLQRLDASRKEFLADVAHELRTPLTYVRGYSQVVADGLAKTEEEEQEYLRLIRDETDRVMRLIEDLFTLAQADEGILRITREIADIGELAIRVAQRMRPKMEEKGLGLSVSSQPDLTADVDVARMEQVLVNLLDNAFRYTSAPGQVKIFIRGKDDSIQIAVRDTGAGIPQADLPFVWERLYRVDKSRSRQQGGTGLGLAMVKRIAELHGGTVAADSEEGVGTTMIIAIPAKAVESQQ